MCKTGGGAGSSAGAGTELNRRRSHDEWTDDQERTWRSANTHMDGGSQVHAADHTPSEKATAGARHCNFMRPGVTSHVPGWRDTEQHVRPGCLSSSTTWNSTG